MDGKHVSQGYRSEPLPKAAFQIVTKSCGEWSHRGTISLTMTIHWQLHCIAALGTARLAPICLFFPCTSFFLYRWGGHLPYPVALEGVPFAPSAFYSYANRGKISLYRPSINPLLAWVGLG